MFCDLTGNVDLLNIVNTAHFFSLHVQRSVKTTMWKTGNNQQLACKN